MIVMCHTTKRLAMSHINHTIRRNEVYHFNLRMGEKTYRKSLKTDSPSLCRRYLSAIMPHISNCKRLGKGMNKADIDVFIEMLISNKVNEVVRLGKAITQPLSLTANSYFEQWFNETSTQRDNQYNYDSTDWGYLDITPPPYPEYPSYANWLSSRLDRVAAYQPDYQAFTSYDAERDDVVFDSEHPHYDDLQHPTIHQAKYDYLNAQVTKLTNNINKAHKEDDPIQLRITLNELTERFIDLLPSPPPLVNTSQENKNLDALLFKDAVEKYIEYAEGQLPKKQQADPKRHMKLWLQDLEYYPIDSINLEDILEAWEIINRFPKNTKNESIESIWELTKTGDATGQPMAFQNAKKYKQELRKFFTWACDITKHSTNNPIATDSTYKLLKDKKHNQTPRTKFSNQQALTITDHCKANLSNPFSWAILLMAYHGMRNSEVTNLTKSDIITDPDSQISYINIKQGKTANAKRKIPIHREILKLGFIAYVQQFKIDIFNFSSTKLTSYYSHELRPSLKIPHLAEDGSRLSLYSFRHTVISKLTAENIQRSIQNKIVGHAQSETQAGYTHLELEILQKYVNIITY
ncbi:hypothetical protein GCM10025855_18160 [Shewanella glacialipiscicola]|uniref:Tyr recombinase domain-containing protein n=3 Tax=Shewanella glacialipiscicola TaxID=614069 RepID=A0ABQ6J2C2_9GAMM|nr:hypothetical protein GCM10025855_18160 [Shewanella glacialipiscicola]